MLDLSDSERDHLTAMRALSYDSEGREIFVGLTNEETARYLQHRRNFISGQRDRDGRDEYLRLHDKHEQARFQVLGMEHALRSANRPPN